MHAILHLFELNADYRLQVDVLVLKFAQNLLLIILLVIEHFAVLWQQHQQIVFRLIIDDVHCLSMLF
jgi:hypothetical protein